MLSGALLDEADPDFAHAGPGDVGFVPQQDVEWLLAERAAQLGVDLCRGLELTGFDAEDDGVRSARPRWAVGRTV
ncbi:FAD-dependent monooxygenase [Streptomyces sp. NPDC006463]|uniref:FAD-dependent monooxygenase n=1 Tax=Streptomyces sp. NPDC006463 TaxID=3364746 RepID=UPI00367C46A7